MRLQYADCCGLGKGPLDKKDLKAVDADCRRSIAKTTQTAVHGIMATPFEQSLSSKMSTHP